MSETMNLGAIRSQVETYLLNTSTDTNSLSWPVSEINGYINEGVLYTQQVTNWFEEFDNIVCTASVSTYTASPRIHQFSRLTWDASFLPQTNEYELDRDDPSWRAAPVNNPFRFYFPQFGQQATIAPYPTPSQNGVSYTFSQELGAVCNMTLVDGVTIDPNISFSQEIGIVIEDQDPNRSVLFFQPDIGNDPFATVDNPTGDLGELIAYSTDELNIGLGYVRLPDTMVNDTDIPQLPAQTHYALAFYATMKCFTREGEFQDVALAQQWFLAYSDWMEAVLENKARWWSTRVRSLEPYEEGSLFAKRLNAIGYPMQLDLKPSYGS